MVASIGKPTSSGVGIGKHGLSLIRSSDIHGIKVCRAHVDLSAYVQNRRM